MSTIFIESTQLCTVNCASCGVLFALPEEMNDQRRRDGEAFHCPSGHRNVYNPNDETARLKRQLAQTQTDLERQEAEVRRVRESRDLANKRAEFERQRANGFKGAMRKTKKRVGAGVCLCCNRTFSALARHMAAKHPEHVPSCTIAGKEPSAP